MLSAALFTTDSGVVQDNLKELLLFLALTSCLCREQQNCCSLTTLQNFEADLKDGRGAMSM